MEHDKTKKLKPLLGIVLANGWSIKNVLHSGALANLQNYFDLLIWTSIIDLKSISNQAILFGVSSAEWISFQPFAENRVHRLARILQKALLFQRNNVSTDRILAESFRGQRPVWQKILRPMVGAISKSIVGTTSITIAEKLRRFLGYRPFYRTDFDRHQPDLVFTCYPVDYNEDPIIYEAQMRNIPTITMVPSWDNLTSKGTIDTRFDLVLVWNDIMRKEVFQFCPRYQPEQVVAIGVPRFEVYRQPLPMGYDRISFFRSLGLDPAKRLLLFSNSATVVFPEQPQVIQHLCDAMKDGSLPGDLQLLIRCHPRDTFDIYDRFNNIERVRVWHSSNYTKLFYNWLPDVDEQWILAAMIRYSDVTMNPFSTITLESAICNKPIASIAYDGDELKPYYDSVLSAYSYSHQVPLMKFGASILCKSRQDLIDTIKAYLIDPSILEKERRKLAQDFCHFYSGNSVDMLVGSLVDFAKQKRFL